MDTRLIFFSKPSISQKEISNINKVLKNKIFSDGFFQKKTEILIKKKIKSKFIALTQSCTDALEMASSLINLKHGDEVIMPSYTFTSTANSVVLRGAKPVFIDCDDTFCLNVNHIESALTDKTKAIVPVHFTGYMTDMEKVMEIANKKNLIVIEDTCESLSSKFNATYLGGFGDIGTFSFYYSHHMTTIEGGMI